MALPGLSPLPAMAAEEEASFTYGHYQEGERNLFGAQSEFSPIEVESLQGSARFKITDRIKFAFNYQQDTWGGATPIATLPLVMGGNGGYTGRADSTDTTVGATPYLIGNGGNGAFLMDRQGRFASAVTNPDGTTSYPINQQLVHTLSLASPEVRKQGDFKLSYEWDEAAVDIGGGISIEDDYESRFGNISTRWDFNQKQTALNLSLSYTDSDTNATVDHDASAYIYDINGPIGANFYNVNRSNSKVHVDLDANGLPINGYTLAGNRQDWGTSLGLTQVLTKSTVLEAGLGYTRSTGYLDNPYKAVSTLFIDPAKQDPFLNCPAAAEGYQCIDIKALFEQRPDERNQWTGNLRLVQHIEPLDAAAHLGYRVFSDDWGITSHTFDADWVQPLGHGWTITPRVRYYSQDSADFYTPFLVTNQAATPNAIDASGREIYYDGNTQNQLVEYFNDPVTGEWLDAQGNSVTEAIDNGEIDPIHKTTAFDRKKLPDHYSSDQRLSGYGALSGGVTVTKQFSKGIALDLGFEYYTHQGSLKIGGGGENSFADFDFWTANAALRVDLAAMSLNHGGSGHHGHHHHGAHAPAGVMFDHMLPKAGDMMVGYRYMYGNQEGPTLNGASAVNDATIVGNGCGPNPCFVTPNSMVMHMHMLDLMYAPTDWLTLMMMPQFMDMGMSMRRLEGAPGDDIANNNVGNPIDESGTPLNIGQHIPHHVQNGHETGGLGDLGLYALFKLYDDGIHHVHITPGFTAPIGDVDIELRRNHKIPGGFIHYGMQLGSGTWDFKPSLTYTGHIDEYSWGAQVNGTLRMEQQNESGYRLGDLFQATAWGSYSLTPWLSASVRGAYTWQGGIQGNFNGLINQFGPMDYPQSYGGRYWDIGFGLSASVPSGDLAGNRISVEWLQPVEDDVNGYQLERDGALSATWSLSF